jgi:hypothetical protein
LGGFDVDKHQKRNDRMPPFSTASADLSTLYAPQEETTVKENLTLMHFIYTLKPKHVAFDEA